MYHVSCEPPRIFWNDDTTCSTRVPCVLPTTDWKDRNPARSRQHAWHSCRAGFIVISENPQGVATHMVLILKVKRPFYSFSSYSLVRHWSADGTHRCDLIDITFAATFDLILSSAPLRGLLIKVTTAESTLFFDEAYSYDSVGMNIKFCAGSCQKFSEKSLYLRSTSSTIVSRQNSSATSFSC